MEGLETVLSETGFNNYHNSSYKIRLHDALRSNKSDVDYICPRYVAKGGIHHILGLPESFEGGKFLKKLWC